MWKHISDSYLDAIFYPIIFTSFKKIYNELLLPRLFSWCDSLWFLHVTSLLINFLWEYTFFRHVCPTIESASAATQQGQQILFRPALQTSLSGFVIFILKITGSAILRLWEIFSVGIDLGLDFLICFLSRLIIFKS